MGSGRSTPTLKKAAAMQVRSVSNLHTRSPVLPDLPLFENSEPGFLCLSVFVVVVLF